MPLGSLQHCSTKFQKKIQIPRAHPPRPDYHLGPTPGFHFGLHSMVLGPGCKAPRASPRLPMARGGRITVGPGVGTTSPHARAPACPTFVQHLWGICSTCKASVRALGCFCGHRALGRYRAHAHAHAHAIASMAPTLVHLWVFGCASAALATVHLWHGATAPTHGCPQCKTASVGASAHRCCVDAHRC